MRRPLAVAALALILFGTEVATGVVSLAAARLWMGVGAFLAGDDLLVATPRFVTGLVLIAAGAGLYGALLWAEGARRRLTEGGSVCLDCGTPTRRVRRRPSQRFLARVLEMAVTRRHCERCGWSGLAT